MKTLELELKKRLLIVETENGEFAYDVQHDENGSHPIKLISKGSELKEGITKQLVHTEEVSDVEDFRHEKIFIDYNDEDNAFTCGFESFISAIEAKGYYWGENPHRNKDTRFKTNHPVCFLGTNDCRHINGKEKYCQCYSYRKAELKTFNPEKTLIFEILL